jgi:hypothetical protein
MASKNVQSIGARERQKAPAQSSRRSEIAEQPASCANPCDLQLTRQPRKTDEEVIADAVLGTRGSLSSASRPVHGAWWRSYGRKHYPGATELLILADSGGANSPRCKVWKCDLQQKLCNAHGLRITVCRYPPGASKWNPIEHRPTKKWTC